MRKIKDATLTIEGPVGVSKTYEAFRPSTADETPIRQAKKAFFQVLILVNVQMPLE